MKTLHFPWTPAVLALYFLVLAVLAVYGLHRLWMVLVFLRLRHREVLRFERIFAQMI